MNKIIRVIKDRLGGEFCHNLKKLREAQKNITSKPVPLGDSEWKHNFIKGYINVSVRFMRLAYLFGGKHTRRFKMCYLPEDYVVDEMKKRYPPPKRSLRIGSFIVADPSEDIVVKRLFELEFPDLFAPYFIDDPCILDLVVNEGPYEFNQVQLNKGDVVIDCGANMGYFSAVASAMKCKVYAFEAIPAIAEKYLSRTVALNSNIQICNCALSDFKGALEFELGEYSNMGTSSAYMSNKGGAITVPCTTVDAFVEENKLERVDFIKADIEGAERYMLQGAVNTLKRYAPKLSICTYHFPDDPEVIRSIIKQANPNYIIEERYKKLYAYVPSLN